jgi:hypothetical protein
MIVNSLMDSTSNQDVFTICDCYRLSGLDAVSPVKRLENFNSIVPGSHVICRRRCYHKTSFLVSGSLQHLPTTFAAASKLFPWWFFGFDQYSHESSGAEREKFSSILCKDSHDYRDTSSTTKFYSTTP